MTLLMEPKAPHYLTKIGFLFCCFKKCYYLLVLLFDYKNG